MGVLLVEHLVVVGVHQNRGLGLHLHPVQNGAAAAGGGGIGGEQAGQKGQGKQEGKHT
mgnify:CR=1 FL=1